MSVNPVHKSFVYDAQSNTSECKHCKTKMAGKHTENLTRHIKRKHADISDEIFGEITAKKKQKNDANQNSLMKYLINKTPTTTVSISKQALLDGCIELVTKNGRPLKLLEDSGFRKIIDPLCTAAGISINPQNIKEEIVKRAATIRSALKSSFNNRLLSIKVDCVSRLDRSIIGINAQYIENGNIEIKTLAMKEIFVKHSGFNLSNIIVDVLQSFAISMDRIYSITVDNAANMICLGKFLNGNAENVNSSQRLHSEEVGKVIQAESQVDDEDDEDENDDEVICDPIPIKIFEEVERNLITNNSISVIRCAAHTLNLAVSDFLKEINEIRSKARTVVKKLRTPTLLNLLRTDKLHKPIIECVTRWGSTYNMFKRLLELKSFCLKSADDIKELHMDENDWQLIENICEILSPAYDISIKLQRKNLLLSDMFFAWYSCKLEVEKKLGWLSLKFVAALKKRGEYLLNNSCVLAAVYLDPRYQILLSDSEKDLAKKHLAQIFEYKSKIDSTETSVESPQSKISSDDELESILEQLDKKETLPSRKTIVDLINCFDNIKRLSPHADVLKFWQNYTEGELKSIAAIVLAAPATQVSVERAFSTLKFIDV